MTSIMTRLRTAVAKRVAYNQTVREIAGMPQEVAFDLGIFREDAEKIAWKHVYGG
jgi:uncharacterized protein YjiS (DUF1127 family)